MSAWRILLGLVEGAVWYLSIWYGLSTIKAKERNLWVAALILLLVAYAGFVLYPWLRHTEFWRNLGKPRWSSAFCCWITLQDSGESPMTREIKMQKIIFTTDFPVFAQTAPVLATLRARGASAGIDKIGWD